MSRTTAKSLNTALGFAAILLWSTTVALSRSLAEQVGTLTAASLIYLLGGVLGCGYQVIGGKLWKALGALRIEYLLGCGGLFAFYEACLYLALGLARDRSQVLEVSLLNYLWPMLTLLLSVPLLHMRASAWLIPGILVAFAGVLFATTQDQPLSWASFSSNLAQNSTPYLLGALAGLSWGLYSTLSRRWAGNAPEGAVPVFMLATGLLLGIGRLLAAEGTRWTGRAVLELLFMAVSSNLAYVFWDRAMRGGDMPLVASFSYLTPLLSIAASSLYLGVGIGGRLWIGCALVISGAIVCKLALREPAT